MRTKSSGRWLARQRRDPFVKGSRAEGRISRAHFKLKQLDERYGLLRGCDRVLELGAAPGGWTAYLAQRLAQGTVVAVDPRPVEVSAENVRFVRGRFGDHKVDGQLTRLLSVPQSDKAAGVDLVLSDMSPDISGIRATDQARSMELVELAGAAASQWLRPGGAMVVKVFQGEGVEAWLRETRRGFGRVRLVKPAASRPDSRENYAVALNYRGAPRPG